VTVTRRRGSAARGFPFSSTIVVSVLFTMLDQALPSPIMRLPPELLISIFSRVPRSPETHASWSHDLVQLLTVCKHWKVSVS
jgi:hypothetical protein